jgi:spermidine/putrescine transport system substrate-binding protein
VSRRGNGRRPIGRREFLRRAAIAGAAIPPALALASCGRALVAPAAVTPAPTRRRRWPIYDDNPPIDDGLPIERGATLRVYEWRDYLARDVLDSFERRYRASDVRVEVQSFLHIDEAIARLRSPGADFDVFFPTIDSLGELIESRLLAPLNHSYLPGLRNLWPDFLGAEDPFYDEGQRYSTPYTVYSSGIGWRTDLVESEDAPGATARPFDVLWNARYRGRVGVYDSYREALSLALLHVGGDPRKADARALSAAADALVEFVHDRGGALTLEGAYEGLPRGEFAAHQAWSGDLISAPRYDDRASRAAAAAALAYWRPSDGSGVVGCDLTAVCAQGRNPVLAHAFVDHLLDPDVALANFSWNGYQPPLREATREAFADPSFRWSRIVPDNLLDAVLTPEEFRRGTFLLELAPEDEARWTSAWSRVTAAAEEAGTREAASADVS